MSETESRQGKSLGRGFSTWSHHILFTSASLSLSLCLSQALNYSHFRVSLPLFHIDSWNSEAPT